MYRRARVAFTLITIPAAAMHSQVTAGIGPVARGASTDASVWTASTQLSGGVWMQRSHAALELEGAVERAGGALRIGAFSARPTLTSGTYAGLRLVSTAEFARGNGADPGADAMSGRTSLAWQRGWSGAWVGTAVERKSVPSIVAGLWRQLGSNASVSVSSTIRHGFFGGTPSRFWTETHWDSVFTDTSGWQKYSVERLYGDSGRAASRVSWAETEARGGWARGRVALDAVVGWRPSIDTARRVGWARGYATVAMARGVALTLGAGTTTRQLPYATSTGHFGMIAVRLAPAQLIRPPAPPEIVAAPAAFVVERDSLDEYVVRVRVPRARVVELSGDFNGWKPVRLTRATEGEWSATLVLKPGTYRMNLRVDGAAWVAPPGTAAVNDDFNGQVGIVVVR